MARDKEGALSFHALVCRQRHAKKMTTAVMSSEQPLSSISHLCSAMSTSCTFRMPSSNIGS